MSSQPTQGQSAPPLRREGTRPTGAHEHHLHPPHVADRRGLTAVGAASVAIALGSIGGLVDVLTGPGLRTAFAVCFIVGCAIAALTVHREDLFASVVMPPLVYVLLALVAGAFSQTVAVGSMLTRQVLELASSLFLGAPVLLTATGVAAVIAVLRGSLGRRPAR